MKYSIYSKLSVGICSAFLITVASSCMEDAYNPNANKNELPPIDQVFGFETRGDVKLTIDYNAPGFQANFKIFDEDPIAVPGTRTLKKGIEPVYSRFTTAKGKFDGTIKIPTAVKEAWLYTDRLGLPACVKLTVANGVITYDAKQAGTVTRSTPSDTEMNNWFGNTLPYSIIWGRSGSNAEYFYKKDDENGNVSNIVLSSIVKWGKNGVIENINGDNVSVISKVGEHTIAGISERATAYIQNKKNNGTIKDLLRTSEVTNVTTKEDGTTLQVTFLGDAAKFKNSFGYYYYKIEQNGFGTSPNNLYNNLRDAKKYIVFPNVSQQPMDEDGLEALNIGTTVKLKFFGENQNKAGANEFPAGYAIGWFLLSDGFEKENSSAHNPQFSIKNSARPNNPQSATPGMMMSSNDIKGTIDNRRFITMFDEISSKLVIGVEDLLTKEPDDYMDLTFIVTSNKDFTPDDKPIIPPVKPIEELTISGTLAFEDTWPKGGDYDMNDVAVKYKRTIKYDKDNLAKELDEEFTFVQKEDAAENTNYFGYLFNAVNGGKIIRGEGVSDEPETSSILISESSLEGMGKTYTVKRTFDTNIDKDIVLNDFNPYIIVTKKGTSFEDGRKKGRTEVHLPKMAATILADTRQISSVDDIYYIDKNSFLPFAIDIAYSNYVLCTEKKKITDVYPRFVNWAKTKGDENKDWYKDAPNN